MKPVELKFEIKNALYYLPYDLRNLLLTYFKKNSVPESYKDEFLDMYRKYNCIFIHIPKNAGTSINLTLYGKKETRHLGMLKILRYFKRDEFENAFKFAIVRHPMDRLISSFHHLSKGGWETNHDNSFLKKHGDVTQNGFGEFVKWLSAGDTATAPVTLVPQHEFICLGRHIMVDYLGKFETIDKDFENISKIIGCSDRLPKSNSTSHTDYTAYFDDEITQLARKVYKKDFELFGYDE